MLRQQVLERLGRQMYRICSTDWFRDPAGQDKKLIQFIKRMVAEANLSKVSLRGSTRDPGL
ncbi:MAG: hypothetical protein JOY71_00475 [Acetobacteraceae bacterium]|nr:hypothetical protein [Acetobacteraceae bacterium]